MRFGTKSIIIHLTWVVLLSAGYWLATKPDSYWWLIVVVVFIIIETLIFFKTIYFSETQLRLTNVLMPFKQDVIFNLQDITCVELRHLSMNYTYPNKILIISTDSKKTKFWININKREGKALMDKLMALGIRVVYPLYSFD